MRNQMDNSKAREEELAALRSENSNLRQSLESLNNKVQELTNQDEFSFAQQQRNVQGLDKMNTSRRFFSPFIERM